jgi:hypothetical protein
MAGALIPLVPLRSYDFSNMIVGTTQTLTVVERIDISQYIDCMITLRVHFSSVISGSINFDLYGDGFTDEDPSLPFRAGSALFSSSAILGSTWPLLLTYGGTVRGHYATLVVTANKTGAGNLKATVSLDAVLRSPDPVVLTLS